MSVYIKGMEMPVDCLACRLSCKHESYMVTGRPGDCPLEEAKTGDQISRADAIDAICKVWCYTTYGMCPHDDGYCKGCDEIEAIDALPSAEAVSREDYHNLLTASDDIDRALREYQAKEEHASADDTFCKSQLITCNRVKECNGVCPFEDALKHADKADIEFVTQTMNGQTVIDHDRDWIIGCIEHDGFIHTHRFDKANQIILDALLADTSSDLISRANAIRWVKTECNPYGKPTLDYDSGLKVIEHLKKMPSELPSTEAEWIPCSERVPKENEYVDNVCKYYLIQDEYGDMHVAHLSGRGWETIESIKALGCDVIAWMPLPEPYREDGEEWKI